MTEPALVTTTSPTTTPGAEPRPTHTTEPQLTTVPGEPATVGQPLAAPEVSVGADAATQQQFAAAAALARGQAAPRPDSLYAAVASQLHVDPAALRQTALDSGRDNPNRLTPQPRRTTPYTNDQFVTAALATDSATPTARPVNTTQLTAVHDTIAAATAAAAKVNLIVHSPDGASQRFTLTGAKPRGTLEVTRIVTDRGQVAHQPGKPHTTTTSPPPTTPTRSPAPRRVAAGLVYAADTDRTIRDVADRLNDHADRYHVMSHGNDTALEVGPGRVSSGQLAADIKADPNWRKRPIVLIACHTGTDETHGFAAQLAQQLPGTPIIAPAGTIWVGSTGHAVVDTHLIQFQASPTAPDQITTTDLPRLLDPHTPLGDLDPIGAIAAIDRYAAHARSYADSVVAATEPSTNANPLNPNGSRQGVLPQQELTALRDRSRIWAQRASEAAQDAEDARGADGLAQQQALVNTFLLAHTALDQTVRQLIHAHQFATQFRSTNDPHLWLPSTPTPLAAFGAPARRRPERDLPFTPALEPIVEEADQGQSVSGVGDASTESVGGDLRLSPVNENASSEGPHPATTDGDGAVTGDAGADRRASSTQQEPSTPRAASGPPARRRPERDLPFTPALEPILEEVEPDQSLSGVGDASTESAAEADPQTSTPQESRPASQPTTENGSRTRPSRVASLIAQFEALTPQPPPPDRAPQPVVGDDQGAADAAGSTGRRISESTTQTDRTSNESSQAAATQPPSTGRDNRASMDQETLLKVADEARADDSSDGDSSTVEASADDVRRALPGYLRRSEALGPAAQFRATTGADTELTAGLARLAPHIPDSVLEDVNADVRDNFGQFLGEGHTYPVLVDGNPADLVIHARFNWDGLQIEKEAKGTAKSSSASDSSHENSVQLDRYRHVDPKAFVVAVPYGVVASGISVPAIPRSTTSRVGATSFKTSTTIAIEDQVEVTVPAEITATIRGADGQPIDARKDEERPPSSESGAVMVEAMVPLRVPTGLAFPDTESDPSPMTVPAALPKRFGVESVVVHADPERGTHFEQVERMLREQGLGDIVRVGAPGRRVLQGFLKGRSLPVADAVAAGPDRAEEGWVTSEPLLRTYKGHDLWHRAFPGRDRALQARLVARQVQVIDTADDAKYEDAFKLTNEETDSRTTDRPWNGWFTFGFGAAVKKLMYVVGPRVWASRTRPSVQTVAAKKSGRQTVTAKGSAVRYRTVYDLEVRLIGQPAQALAGGVETIQWTTRERARGTSLDNDPTGWRGRLGNERTHFAPAAIEHGRSFGGAYIHDLDGSRQLRATVINALRDVPGGHRRPEVFPNIRNRGLPMRRRLLPAPRLKNDAFIRQFDGPELAGGLTGKVQAILSRQADAETQLSDRELRFLLDRIVGPGLEIPLVKNGKLHDYTTVVTVKGSLSRLSDGEILEQSDQATTVKATTKTAISGSQDKGWTSYLGVDGRLLGPLGRIVSATVFGPRGSYTKNAGHSFGLTRGHGSEITRSPGLTEDGDPADVPMREFAAVLTVTTTMQSNVRPNQNRRSMLPGKPGLHVPTVASGSGPPREHQLDVRLLVPEHRVTTSPPPPVPAAEPVDKEWMSYPPAVHGASGGDRHQLDGSTVETFLGTEHLQEGVKETLIRATNDPIWGFADGPISGAISRALSPDRLTGNRELFSRPLSLSQLAYGRRRADTYAEVRVRLQPRNPRILPSTEFHKVKDILAGGSSGGAKKGESWGLSGSVTAFGAMRGGGADPSEDRFAPGGVFLVSGTFLEFTRDRRYEHNVSGVSKLKVGGRPERRVLVQLDVGAEIVAETRRRGNLDLLEVLPDPPLQRVGQRFTLPNSVVMWMTEEQARRLKEDDEARSRVFAEVELQLRHHQESAAQAEKHDAELTSQRIQHNRDNVPVDQRRHERDQLVQRHQEERTGLLNSQRRERAEALSVGPASDPVGQVAEHARDKDIDDVEAPTPTTRTITLPAMLGTSGRPSLGIGGPVSTLDLSNRVGAVRRAVAATIGGAHGASVARALLPESSLDTPHDNVRTLQTFLANAGNHLANAINGGRSLLLRLEGRFRGHSYQMTLTASMLREPEFEGIAHVDELSVVDKTSISATDAVTRSRKMASVFAAMRAVATGSEGQSPEEQKVEGPVTVMGGGGLASAGNWGVRAKEFADNDKLEYSQSLTVKGPVATFVTDVVLNITVTGHELPDTGATVQESRPLALRVFPNNSRVDGLVGAAGEVVSVPSSQLGNAAGEEWRNSPEHDSLPEPAQYAVEHLYLDVADLHDAAKLALANSGATVDVATQAALRATINPTNLKGGLPAMLAGRFPVPLPHRTKRELYLDARLVRRPKFAGANMDVTISSSAKNDRANKVMHRSGSTYMVETVGLLAGGLDPPVADPVSEGNHAGLLRGGTLVEQQHYETGGGRQYDASATSDAHDGATQPSSTSAPDDTLTQGLSYTVEFRLIAQRARVHRQGRRLSRRPMSRALLHRLTPRTPRNLAGAELRITDAITVRMKDEAARKRTGVELPEEVRQTAKDLAESGEKWAKEVNRRDGLRAQESENAEALATAEEAAADAEANWWNALQAHEHQLATLRAAHPLDTVASDESESATAPGKSSTTATETHYTTPKERVIQPDTTSPEGGVPEPTNGVSDDAEVGSSRGVAAVAASIETTTGGADEGTAGTMFGAPPDATEGAQSGSLATDSTTIAATTVDGDRPDSVTTEESGQNARVARGLVDLPDPLASAEVLKAGPLPTPADGRCQLYAIIGSEPDLVGTRLAAAGLDTPALRSWLGNPRLVHAQLAEQTTTAAQRDARGLVPQTLELGHAAENLRQLVERHLHTLGPANIPAAAITVYRRSRIRGIRAGVDALDRDAVIGRLQAAGITTLNDPSLLPTSDLRDRYIHQRLIELVGSGIDQGVSRAIAEAEVPLASSANGISGSDLADESLSAQQMFGYLSPHHDFSLQNLSDQMLREQLMMHLLDPVRPAEPTEFADLVNAVRHWERHWQDDPGEAYAALLASALDSRIRIHSPGHVQTLGHDDAPLINIFRDADHYQATIVLEPVTSSEGTTASPGPTDTATPSQQEPGGQATPANPAPDVSPIDRVGTNQNADTQAVAPASPTPTPAGAQPGTAVGNSEQLADGADPQATTQTTADSPDEAATTTARPPAERPDITRTAQGELVDRASDIHAQDDRVVPETGQSSLAPSAPPETEGESTDRVGRADPTWVLMPGRYSVGEFGQRYGWLARVNPWSDRGGEFDTNCVLAAIATDMTLAERLDPVAAGDGAYFQAPPATVLPAGDLSNYTGNTYRDVPDYAAVDEVMWAAPVGSRGIVVVTDAEGEPSHAFNVVRDDRGVAYLDGQVGDWATAPRQPKRIRFMPVTDAISEPRVVVGGGVASGWADLVGVNGRWRWSEVVEPPPILDDGQPVGVDAVWVPMLAETVSLRSSDGSGVEVVEEAVRGLVDGAGEG
ncbi:toxin glutamine deamidase domain-containing protein, partial [Salinispora arenicola]|uniref:toxin glutamine deamidase domain-containing protein n=1 Tax=Salinispora arenicola TaxID=168697 RepID=UPI001E51C9E7